MIFQGLYNVLDLYFNNIELFYNHIDEYFQTQIINSFGNNRIEKGNLRAISEKICSFLINYFIELGFKKTEIENKFLDPILEIENGDEETISVVIDLYKKKIAPLIYEILLDKIIAYLVDVNIAPLLLKFKDEGFLPIELIMEIRNLRTLFERVPNKLENLRKYVHIQENIIFKLRENKQKIESLEDLEEPQYKLQLIYLIYRIIDFFNLQKTFNFSHIKSYLEENIDEWLIDIPLVSLRNPDIYFCGIYLAKYLNVKLDNKKISGFLLLLYEEAINRYESPIMEATDGLYYFFKSTELMKLWLNHMQINNIMITFPRFVDMSYIKNLETSQLVVILKLYRQLGISGKESEIETIIEEIDTRITPEGVKQERDGFITSEAIYYVLFINYMRNTLEKLKDYDFLNSVIQRIYRNLALLDFSEDTNYDLISELFYSCESLKLFNCIETKEMIIHIAKYLFPEQILTKITNSEEIARTTAKFRHLKVNRITGETI